MPGIRATCGRPRAAFLGDHGPALAIPERRSGADVPSAVISVATRSRAGAGLLPTGLAGSARGGRREQPCGLNPLDDLSPWSWQDHQQAAARSRGSRLQPSRCATTPEGVPMAGLD